MNHAEEQNLLQALQDGLKKLDEIAEQHFQNEAMFAWVNNEAFRDEIAREQRTFNNGRFERPRAFGGQTWYCCYTTAGLQAQGMELDPVNLLQALQEGLKKLDEIAEQHFQNEAMFAWVNNDALRDEIAREQRTYKNGRFERPHAFGGIWYCCYKTAGLQAQGMELDPVN